MSKRHAAAAAVRCPPSARRYRVHRARAPRGLAGCACSAGMRAGRAESRNSRSASRTASSMSWVTSSVVTGRRSTSMASSSRRRTASGWSSDANGSSRMRSRGSTANARASATRRASPSDSSPGKCERWAASSSVSNRVASVVSSIRRDQADILFDRAPRQQPRLLEHHAERAVVGEPDGAVVVAVEAGDDPQQRGLAAARRADERADLAVAQREIDVAEHVELIAGRSRKGLSGDANLKQSGFASGPRVVQAAAPGTFRSPA